MHHFQHNNYLYLEPPHKARTILFCDFDETYYPHAPDEQKRQDFYQLEKLIQASSSQLIFGWVTGSSLASIEQKMALLDAKLIPHFIASSLGTMVTYHHSSNPLVIDQQWTNQIEATGFSKPKIATMLNEESMINLKLSAQPSNSECPYKQSYYMTSISPSVDKQRIEIIRRMAKREKISVSVSRCNPMTNDPTDCYDVDFTPLNTGKADFVYHLCRKFNIGADASYAFGDSGNDIEMLKAVGHGYLVANATEEAKILHSKVSPFSHSKAIQNVIQTLF